MAFFSLLCDLSYQNSQEVEERDYQFPPGENNDHHMNNHKQMGRADVSSVDRIASCGWRKRKVEILEQNVGQIFIGRRWGGEHTHPWQNKGTSWKCLGSVR